MSKKSLRRALFKTLAPMVLATLAAAAAEGATVLPSVPVSVTYEAAVGTWEPFLGTWNGVGAWVNAPYEGGFGAEVRAGFWGAQYRAPIFSFQLPALPEGEHVVSAKVELLLMYPHGASYNVDLDVLNITAASTMEFSYFQAAGIRIADDFMTPASPNWGPIATSDSQSAALGAWIDTSGQYVAGSFLNLRLKYDAQPGDYTAYRLFPSASLVLTTVPVPEPTMLGGIAVTGLLLLRRRCGQRA